MVKTIVRTKEDGKASKSKKQEEKVPISQMGLVKVEELSETYTIRVETNFDGIYRALGAIKTQVTPEILEALLYGCVIDNEEITILKPENKAPENFEFGYNAFRGLLSIESLCEIGIGVNKEELAGKKVFIPFTDVKLNVFFDEIGTRAYWALHSAQKREKCLERAKELRRGEDDGVKSSLEDFLPSSSSSEEDEQDLKNKGGRKKGGRKKGGK